MTASDMSAKGPHHLFDHRNRAANVIVLKSRRKLPLVITLLCPVTTMASFRIGVAATAGDFQMLSSLVRHPATLEHDPQAQQKREFDRRRTAIEIVQLRREVELSSTLGAVFKNRH